ncbi:MAG: MarR family transcriptional regulator [Bacilli bacterium]
MKKENQCCNIKEAEILGLFRYLNKQLELSFNAKLEKLGLTGQQGRIVFFINYHTNVLKMTVRQSDIEERFRLTKSTVSGLVNRLINNEFIQKDDRSHGYAITLTEKGKKTVSTFKSANAEMREILLKGFAKDEKDRIKESLKHMIDNMEGMK